MNALDVFGDEVSSWHRSNWPTMRIPILAATKVAEEAGELVGAITKYAEDRGPWVDVLNELGDVVIAAAGTAARLEEIARSARPNDGRELILPTFGEVVLTRWDTVAARRYGVRA